MKAIKRWKYYCDFCKKSGGNKGVIVAHERSCTNNPNRVCKMCEVIGDPQPDLPEMIRIVQDAVASHTTYHESSPLTGLEFMKIYRWVDNREKEVLDNLWEITDCHVCILAALSQSGYPFLFESFKFKEINDEFWAQENMDEELALYHSCCG